jgi:hypothetical protein
MYLQHNNKKKELKQKRKGKQNLRIPKGWEQKNVQNKQWKE